MFLGAALIFVLSYLDAAWEDVVITATIVIAPFLTALVASARWTAAVAAFAIFAAIVSGGYNDNYGTSDYYVRLMVVIAGATFAIAPRRPGAGSSPTRQHFALLRGAAQIADSVVTIPEVVERVGDLLVPAFADVCVIDVLRGGRVERLGVVASTPRRRGDRGAPAPPQPRHAGGAPRGRTAAGRARRRGAPAGQRAR